MLKEKWGKNIKKTQKFVSGTRSAIFGTPEMAKMTLTEGIQSYLRIWGTCDQSGPVRLTRKNGGFIGVA